MATYWLDYSAARLDGNVIKSTRVGPAGEYATGVIRYVDAPNLIRTKHTTLDEYRSHVNAGLRVQLVHQGSTTDADGGYSAGVARGQRAKAGAEYLGYTGVVYFTNDRTTLPDPSAWRAYLDGAASVLGVDRVGAYGFRNAIDAAQGHASAFWQSGRRSELSPEAHAWQDNNTQVTVGGITCDRNLILADYFPGGGSAPGTTPVPITDDDEEDDMYRELLPASATTKYPTFPWDGRKAVLNVIGTQVGNPVFLGKPLNWGPNGGTGGGDSTVAGVNPSRVEINQPGQYTIPAGTTRIAYTYSSNADHWVTIVAVA